MGSNGQVTYKKLQDGTWGLHGPIGLLVEGQTIQVATKGGKEKPATVGKVLASFEDGNAIADIVGSQAPQTMRSAGSVMTFCPHCSKSLLGVEPPPRPSVTDAKNNDDIPF